MPDRDWLAVLVGRDTEALSLERRGEAVNRCATNHSSSHTDRQTGNGGINSLSNTNSHSA
jgi:hypothetical protein